MDTSGDSAKIAKRWHDAREKRKQELTAIEGEVNYEGLQRFLAEVHTLTGDGAYCGKCTWHRSGWSEREQIWPCGWANAA
jgi:hypothetical protein